jgi:hypothetical protein
MTDSCSPATPAPLPDPEVTARETAHAVLADLAELDLPGGSDSQRRGNAHVLDRLAEELAECSAMIRSLPARPTAMSGYDCQLLAALRTSHASGEDIAEAIAHGLARLAAELGSSLAVTANRPGSWEAAHVAGLLAGTVGLDDENLPLFGGLA